jgi:hypothetical protein
MGCPYSELAQWVAAFDQREWNIHTTLAVRLEHATGHLNGDRPLMGIAQWFAIMVDCINEISNGQLVIVQLNAAARKIRRFMCGDCG